MAAQFRQAKLTKSLVQSLKPGPKEYWVTDTEIGGFHVRVSPQGAIDYRMRYKEPSGKRVTRKFASVTAVDLEEARKWARDITSGLGHRVDVVADREEEAKASTTLATFWPEYLEEKAKPKNGARTVEEKERNWRLHIEPRLGNKEVRKITRSDIINLKMAMKGEPAAANNVFALLSTVLNYAKFKSLITVNPCEGVEKFEIAPRDIVFTRDELGRLDKALEEEPALWAKTAFIIIVGTGCRRSEIKDALVDEFHLDETAPYWNIPKERIKGKADHRYYLTDSAATAVRDWLKVRPFPETPWVFPSEKGTGPKWQLQKPWVRLKKRAKVTRGVIHSIRHTILSYAADDDMAPTALQAYAAHKDIKTTMKYIHRTELRKQEALAQQVQRAMVAARSGKKTADLAKDSESA